MIDISCEWSRRRFVLATAAAGFTGLAGTPRDAGAATVRTNVKLREYGNGTLPPGIRSRVINDVNI
ncbi:MAG: hypothetical protein M3O26_15910 [Pseudomonadota bacterium]|nr:hypothetical protein [Pseudomonadota bacterium]